jgi:adenosine deaminase
MPPSSSACESPLVGLNLHTHLEGCVRPETAADLALTMNVPEPAGGWDAALRMKEPADLTAFLAHVAAAYPVLGAPDAMRRVAREAVEDAAADGCDFLEIRFGPATHARADFSIPQVIAAACEGLEEGHLGTGLAVGLVVCLLRHSDDETNLGVARAAAAAAGKGVVGLDVAGDELRFPSLAPYREPYAIAAAAELGVTAHAAEAAPGAAAVEAVATLGVTRIGHGSHIADDPATLAWAAAEGIAIEVCPTSNVLTGAAPSVREHPLHAFLEARCRVVLGDDNPINIGSRISGEERRLVEEGGLTREQVREIHLTACDVAFTDEATRAAVRARVEARPVGAT